MRVGLPGLLGKGGGEEHRELLTRTRVGVGSEGRGGVDRGI